MFGKPEDDNALFDSNMMVRFIRLDQLLKLAQVAGKLQDKVLRVVIAPDFESVYIVDSYAYSSYCLLNEDTPDFIIKELKKIITNERKKVQDELDKMDSEVDSKKRNLEDRLNEISKHTSKVEGYLE